MEWSPMSAFWFFVGAQLGITLALRLPPAPIAADARRPLRKLKEKYVGAANASLESLIMNMANESDKCDLCSPNWLFLVSSGPRTGAATVMDMMNAVDGVYLAGEYSFMAMDLMEVYGKIQEQGWGASRSGAWQHRVVSRQGVLCAVHRLTRELIGASAAPPGTHTMGFRAIVWGNRDGLPDFLAMAFPCAKFVVNTRHDSDAQYASITRALATRAPKEKIVRATHSLEKWHSVRQNRTRLIRTEDFNEFNFNLLLGWLNVAGCRFMSVCHSNKNGSGSDRSNVVIDGSCSLR
mmetsp:Transcript_83200/g.220722  ORF Transcript_83200/g.220722 Transcript_83200/m.220722 type:complete len:293 (-) Transcript_83200:173-1051(-)